MDQTYSFGYWLRRRRKALDLTQVELAQRVNCSADLIQKIEADARRPSRQLAEKLAECLGIAADERPAFVQAARAERSTDHLAVPSQPVEQPVVALPQGTITFLFTDIQGSSQLWEQHARAMPAALARHDTLLKESVAAHGGVVFKTIGDSVLAAFAQAQAALAAALAAQRAIRREVWELPEPPRVRVALHTGSAESRDGDYFGPVLNRAARLLDCGHGGQILLSLATEQLVREHLPPDVRLRDPGTHRLKDLSLPEQIFQLVASDLPASFPTLNTLDARHTNLPTQPTALLGREQEVAKVATLLRRSGARLVSLTGPGGVGKTRLGFQIAAELVDDFADGVYFVDLAPIREASLVTGTIATTLGVRESGAQPVLASLKGYLRDKRMLLLLDNFEQVLEAAPSVAELLGAAPQLKLLVTTREVLKLRGEKDIPVQPLAVPAPAHLPGLEQLSQYAAVALFIERALDARADFEVTNANAPAVAEICARLDGLPLAIELAAARVKLFPPQALLARLENRLAFLTGGARDLPARQQTIRNTIDWSYDLLSDAERRLFARLAIFAGGWTLEAAQAVCSADSDLDIGVLDGLVALADQSLLRQEQLNGRPRFRMLETIREYALERLAASGVGEGEMLRRRHAHYFLALAEQAAREMVGAKLVFWLQHLDDEDANLRAALDWSHAATSDDDAEVGLRLAGALLKYWELRGRLSAGRAHLAAALSRLPAATIPRATALSAAGWLAFYQGDSAPARLLFEESLAIARRLDNQPGIALALSGLARVANQQQDGTTAVALLEEMLAIEQRLGNQPGIARSLFIKSMITWIQTGPSAVVVAGLEQALELYRNLGDKEQMLPSLIYISMNLWLLGDYTRAITAAAECLALAQDVGAKDWIGAALINIGQSAWLQGDYARATALHTESLALSREIEHTAYIAQSLRNLGADVWAQGDHVRATALHQESLPLYEIWGDKWGMAECIEGLGWAASSQGQATSDTAMCLRAVCLLGAAATLREAADNPMAPAYRTVNERVIAEARAQLGEAAFAAAWAEGCAMTIEQAIAYALEATVPRRA